MNIAVAETGGNLIPGTGKFAAHLLHTAPNPLNGAPANTRREIMDPDFNNFGPRFGLAYRITDRTVFRGGYSVFFVSTYFQQAEDLVENFPLLLQNNVSLDLERPTKTVQDVFSGSAAETGFGGWPQNKRNRNSYSQQWNVAIERELLQDTVFTLTYVGQKGTKLIMYTDINDATPGPGAVDPRRPVRETVDGFPVGNVNAGENVGTSSYNALQAKLTKRFSNGLQMLSSYTWGKSLDIQSSLFDNTQIQDQNCRGCDKGRSSWDMRQTWTTSFIYESPFGKGRKFLSSLKGVPEAILGGWQSSGIVGFRSGPPVNIRIRSNNANVGGFGTQRPNVKSGQGYLLPTDQRTIDRWFNTAAFELAPRFQFGTFGRNVIDGPGQKLFDFSLSKRFNVGESRYFEFRSEFFNFFNHPNFSLPGGTLGTANFGRIFSTSTNPRDIQFALKFYF
ncbi:MAG: hypothetical protein L0338_07335 [Acidobacteria bacterium]|nr:hypothetical protein [Acidobacteriota bacterium]